MKKSRFCHTRTRLKTASVLHYLLFASFFFLCMPQNRLHAQGPKLSIQGILKKASGEAVNDGNYNLTFKLYTVETGGVAIWDEIQNNVEVISGIYSTVLGNDSTLNITFNQLYYLGVTVGSTEMTPRVQLTSAPYALSLIGTTNKFPSSGQVLADSIKVNGNVLARGGVPGNNGANRNGYGFSGNNGDKDTGLFSTSTAQEQKVSLFVNNSKEVEVTADTMFVNGTTKTNNLRLPREGKVNYNGLNDWRLVYDDNLAGGANGWQVYNKLPQNEYIGWNNGTAAGTSPVSGDNSKFKGRYLYPASNEQVLKKFYDLSAVGTYTYIKVKFKYYFIDTWNGTGYDEGNNDVGFAAFAETAAGAQMHVGWMQPTYTMEYVSRFSTDAFDSMNDWEGADNRPEFTQYVEMVANKNASSNPSGFWLMFGCSLNNVVSDERYGVGMIEIWVK